jgi:D-alanyl-lipoteichoic acid acyltransferase DltB (MBOAT superfamily)
MRFDSFAFVLFALVVYGLYFLLSHRAQNWMLLVASYFFYACWDWRFLSLLWLSTLIDFFAAQLIARADPLNKRRILAIAMAINLGFLAVFKYYNFFVASLRAGFDALGLHVLAGAGLDVILPVGISFYTFQSMSYTIDVYRGDVTPVKNLRDFALYVAFFPHMVAGPIQRKTTLLPQIEQPRRVKLAEAREGFWLILLGYYAKVVVADNLAPWVERGFHGPEQAGALTVMTGVYAFAAQIYGDFLGYSSIARGLGLLMGVRLMHNFQMPYLATNPSDFWRRWHISLSNWLRDYLYISLGGNRGTARRTARNLMITMVLGGLWHGAAWHYIAWGFYHGALLVVHRGVSAWRLLGVIPRWVKVFVFFQLTCVGWILFRVEALSDAPIVLARFFGGWASLGDASAMQWKSWGVALMISLPLIGVDLLRERESEMNVFARWPVPSRVLAAFVMFGLIVLSGVVGGAQFIYFQF